MNVSDSEKQFKLYLKKTKELTGNTVRNYLSDFRCFCSWLKENGKIKIEDITPLLLIKYKTHLLTNRIAKATAKRRLSTIRIFCQFCLNQQLLKKNPALELENPSDISPQKKEINDWLSKFGAYLKTEGMTKNTIKNYVADIRGFLAWEEIKI